MDRARKYVQSAIDALRDGHETERDRIMLAWTYLHVPPQDKPSPGKQEAFALALCMVEDRLSGDNSLSADDLAEVLEELIRPESTEDLQSLRRRSRDSRRGT